MRKITANHNEKDRIICLSNYQRQTFFYQAYGSNMREYLFDTPYSGSVFAYFRDYGRNLTGRGFSLTIKELYRFNHYKNVKLAHTMERIPIMVNYVLKYQNVAVSSAALPEQQRAA